SLAHRAGAAGPHRQPRENHAARLHPPRRLRHHGGRPRLPRAAGARRGLSALRARRPAEVRRAEERARAGPAAGLGGLTRAQGVAGHAAPSTATSAAYMAGAIVAPAAAWVARSA